MNTVGELIALNYQVRVYCLNCKNHSLLDLHAIAKVVGDNARLDQCKMRCGKCQSAQADFRISHSLAGLQAI